MGNVAYLPGAQAEPEAPRGPQVEDGFTRIANELFEAIITAPLTDRERRVAMAIMRLTYGWNKKADRIADSQIADVCHIPRQKVNKVKQDLIAKKVILVEGPGHGLTSINKHFDEWEFTAKHTPKQRGDTKGDNVPHGGDKDCTPRGFTPKTEDNLLPNGSKDTSKKSKPKKWGDPIDHELANEMAVAISDDGQPVKFPAATWANDFRLMRERDGKSVEDIRWMLDWAAKHHFWSTVILSPYKLRQKWLQMSKQAKTSARPSGMTQADRIHAANQEAIRQAVENRRTGDDAWAGETYDHDGGAW